MRYYLLVQIESKPLYEHSEPMTYQQTIDYLFAATPLFEQQGGVAYKPGLERMLAMAEAIGNPHNAQGIRYIHVGGTNGKGSTSCTLAAIVKAAGYRTGLFTSPHLVDFRERIRVDGVPITQNYVIDFVARVKPLIEEFKPSFFEFTTLMAFDYFAQQKVEVAIIEVGMGGRLDCTNIISPLLSIVTNISIDHTQFLGNTLALIAQEKAGIIKSNTPIVLGEVASPEVSDVFRDKALQLSAPLYIAEKNDLVKNITSTQQGITLVTLPWGKIHFALAGVAQEKNARTLLSALDVITKHQLLNLSQEAIAYGFEHVVESMHLLGRWQRVATQPDTYLDTGHNEAGIRNVVAQLRKESYQKLHIIFGMVTDKDWITVLGLLPQDAHYYFVTPDSGRALLATSLAQEAAQRGLIGNPYPSIEAACIAAQNAASPRDLIYIGGSNYVVAQALQKCFPEIIEKELFTK